MKALLWNEVDLLASGISLSCNGSAVIVHALYAFVDLFGLAALH